MVYEHVLENDTHKLLWDFNIQNDHLIPARRPDLIIINKKRGKLQNCRLCCPGGPWIDVKECEKKDKYLDLAREFKKLWNMKVMIVPIVIVIFFCFLSSENVIFYSYLLIIS